VKGAEVRASFEAAGIPCVLLKGRAFAALLYADGASRPYSDCDLLVRPDLHERAGAVLAGLGFYAAAGASHAIAWHRSVDAMWVDLHQTLPLLGAEPERVWATLSRRATSMTVGGAPTQVLDPAATALLTALHAVHHGPDAARPREDLERAIDTLDGSCWQTAAELARELNALAPLGTGLRLVSTGVVIADRLGLPWAPGPRTLLDWNDAPWGATVWESLATAPHARARILLLAPFLAPSPDFLRARSALARRGRSGLVLAYLVRPFGLAVKALASFAPWLRARRE
jgi:hypothetical protein